MKQVTANSIGTIWRSDVMHLSGYAPVEVIDLDGKRIAIVEQRGQSRKTFYVDGHRVNSKTLWNTMHRWSEIIAAQNTRNFAATCKTIVEGFNTSRVV